MKRTIANLISISLFLLLSMGFHGEVLATIPSVERQALIDLYNANNYDDWDNWQKTGWKTPPLAADGFAKSGTESNWSGVTVENDVVTKLAFSFRSLTTIPDSIENLTNLTELDLHHNQLTTIPDSIGNLTKLTQLDLYENQLTTIPDSIGDLINLTELRLSNNQLTSIPDSIGNLTKLTGLFLDYNQLMTIPDSIGNLTELTWLVLCWNQLTGSLPGWIGNLTTLKYLFLFENQLTAIPDSIGNLINLTELDLSNNQLISIPDSIGNLTKLTHLPLNGNRLTSIPDSIGNLTKLTGLTLSNNQLMAIPESIGNLTKLTGLFLGYNQLTGTIPSEIGNLTLLNGLYLQGNHLEGEIPASIKNLTAIGTALFPGYINLCGNRLFTNDLSVKAFLDSKHENGDFEACQSSSRILTQTDHTLEVKKHEFVTVYGASSGSNEIHVKNGATLQFMHALGHNTIVLEANPTDFQVWRSGATVYMRERWGWDKTQISIPATTTEQTIRFTDKDFSLRIENGKVMLNSQVITLEKKKIETP